MIQNPPRKNITYLHLRGRYSAHVIRNPTNFLNFPRLRLVVLLPVKKKSRNSTQLVRSDSNPVLEGSGSSTCHGKKSRNKKTQESNNAEIRINKHTQRMYGPGIFRPTFG